MDLPVHRFTRQERQRLLELGILPASVRTELLDGLLIDEPPLSARQSACSDALEQQVRASLPPGFEARREPGLVLDEANEVTPTLVVYEGERVCLVIEVADDDLRYAQLKKARVYGVNGVPEYWLVSLPESNVRVHRAPCSWGYGFSEHRAGRDELGAESVPGLRIRVDSLLVSA